MDARIVTRHVPELAQTEIVLTTPDGKVTRMAVADNVIYGSYPQQLQQVHEHIIRYLISHNRQYAPDVYRLVGEVFGPPVPIQPPAYQSGYVLKKLADRTNWLLNGQWLPFQSGIDIPQAYPQPGPVVPPPANPVFEAQYIPEVWSSEVMKAIQAPTVGSLGTELTYEHLKQAIDLLNEPLVAAPKPAPPVDDTLAVGDIADHWYRGHDNGWR